MSDRPTKQTTAEDLGTYRGKLIPAFIDPPGRGGRHRFVGIAVEDEEGAIDLAQLRDDEVVIYPGLIYRRELCT